MQTADCRLQRAVRLRQSMQTTHCCLSWLRRCLLAVACCCLVECQRTILWAASLAALAAEAASPAELEASATDPAATHASSCCLPAGRNHLHSQLVAQWWTPLCSSCC